MIKVLLVDDHPMVRRGLQFRLDLEPDLEIVGQADGCPEALALAQSLSPDVVVMGAEMPDLRSIAAVGQVRELASCTAVVMLGLYGDPDTRRLAREAGAITFVEKQGAAENLLAEIRRAARCNARSRPPVEGLFSAQRRKRNPTWA